MPEVLKLFESRLPFQLVKHKKDIPLDIAEEVATQIGKVKKPIRRVATINYDLDPIQREDAVFRLMRNRVSQLGRDTDDEEISSSPSTSIAPHLGDLPDPNPLTGTQV